MIPPPLQHGAHLARRFFGSLSSAPPARADDEWACARLGPGEQLLWRRMSNPDRRHAVAVARAVDAALGHQAPADVLAAALLHDVGKVVSGLGTWPRVGATLVWGVLDRRPDPERPARWAHAGSAPVRRLGQYRLHPELGAALLVGAGAAPLTADWARQHHQPADRWTVPAPVARILKDCDDD